jgi:DNA-directed RNA polymerase subunit M/transcription elongation factor TFIIS
MSDVKNLGKPVAAPLKSVNPAEINSESIEKLLADGNVDQALKLLQARRELVALMGEEEQAIESSKELEQRMLAIEEDIRRTAERQAACAHMKPNYKPAVGGMRDSRGNVIYICQNCQKLWKNDALPMHLRAELPAIGGPLM